jgi:hypothetical protein
VLQHLLNVMQHAQDDGGQAPRGAPAVVAGSGPINTPGALANAATTSSAVNVPVGGLQANPVNPVATISAITNMADIMQAIKHYPDLLLQIQVITSSKNSELAVSWLQGRKLAPDATIAGESRADPHGCQHHRALTSR